MNYKQSKAFVKSVKGIPIRWSRWLNIERTYYFIPDGALKADGKFGGMTVYRDGTTSLTDTWDVCDGFDGTTYVYKWELASEAFYHELIKLK